MFCGDWFIISIELLENLIGDQFGGIFRPNEMVGCGSGIMRRSGCLVVGQTTVCSCGFLFDCMVVGQASDSMMALM